MRVWNRVRRKFSGIPSPNALRFSPSSAARLEDPNPKAPWRLKTSIPFFCNELPRLHARILEDIPKVVSCEHQSPWKADALEIFPDSVSKSWPEECGLPPKTYHPTNGSDHSFFPLTARTLMVWSTERSSKAGCSQKRFPPGSRSCSNVGLQWPHLPQLWPMESLNNVWWTIPRSKILYTTYIPI